MILRVFGVQNFIHVDSPDIVTDHYENTPIQIYRNFNLQKPKLFR